MVAQRGVSGRLPAAAEAGQRERRLGNGERTAHAVAVGQLFIGGHRLRGPEVDAAQNDVGLGAGLHVGLDGRLAVELYGQVDDVAALHEAVGRGVGPAAGNVDAHGAAGPHNLVGGHATAGCRSLRHGGGARGQGRRGPVGGRGGRQSLAQQGKGPLLLREAALAVAAVEAGQLGAEHGVVDAGHERCMDVDGRRFGHVVAGKLAGGVSQVELVEDAVLVVQGQPRPGFGPQPRALRREPAQVGPGRDLLGTHLGCLLETGTGLGRPVLAQHAGQQLPGGLHAFGHGEQGLLLQVAVKTVVVAIGAHGPVGLAHGHKVYALARLQRECPVVAGHAGDDVLARERPARAHVAVLYPDVHIAFGEPALGERVLHEDGGVGLSRVVHDAPLVVH